MIHTKIDFSQLILGEKLYQQDRKLQFDDLYLCKMIDSVTNQSFYDQDSIKNVIDLQFISTKKYMHSMFMFYLFCFIIPLTLTIILTFGKSSEFVKDQGFMTSSVQWLYFLGLFPQVVFFCLEIVEIKQTGIAYLSTAWNYFDIS